MEIKEQRMEIKEQGRKVDIYAAKVDKSMLESVALKGVTERVIKEVDNLEQRLK